MQARLAQFRGIRARPGYDFAALQRLRQGLSLHGAVMTREEWLQSAVNALRPMFQDAGHPLPTQLHISIGFASTRKAIGECWSPSSSADSRHQIFIAPTHASDLDVLETVAHELCHAASTRPSATYHVGKSSFVLSRLRDS